MNNSALQRLAYKAGAVRVSSAVYDVLRTVGRQYLTSIVRAAITYCEYENKKIISEDHAIHAIEFIGFSKMYKAVGDIKTCPKSTKRKLISKIKDYQDQSDCLTMSKGAIEAEIKTISRDFATHIKWSKEALININFALEYLLYKLLFSALKVTINSKRKTLLDSDIKLTIDLVISNCKNIQPLG